MLDDTKIEEKVIVEDYLKTIKKYTKGMIECAEHTFFRLSEKQGKIITCEELNLFQGTYEFYGFSRLLEKNAPDNILSFSLVFFFRHTYKYNRCLHI